MNMHGEAVVKVKQPGMLLDKANIKWVDIAKAICIVSMVMGHAGVPFVRLIYMFHMPAFLILSGFTYSGEKYTIKAYVKKKFFSLVVPTFIANFLFICLYRVADMVGIYGWLNTAPYMGAKEAVKQLMLNVAAPDFGGATWFLLALFWAEILFKIIQVMLSNSRFDIPVGIALGLLGYFTATQQIYLPYLFDLGLYACMFFTVGVFLRRYNVLEKRINPLYAAPLALAAVWVFERFFFVGQLPMNWPTRQFANPLVQLASVMACFYLLYLLAHSLAKTKLLANVMQYVGKHTFSILVYHFLIFRFLVGLLVLIDALPVIALSEFPIALALQPWWLIVVAVTVALCMLLAFVAEKNTILNYLVNAIVPKKIERKPTLGVRLRQKAAVRPALRYFGYALLLYGIYYGVLWLIFPGYFTPLVPHHPDIIEYPFDMPISTVGNVLLYGSRPVGQVLTWFFGLFGMYKGVMVSGILCTFGSMLVTVYCVEKQLKTKIWLPALVAYLFLIFSSSSFYLNYTFDIYNVYALLFSVLTLLLWYKTRGGKFGAWGYVLLVVLSMLNYLSKETYIVSILFFFFAQVFLEQGKQRRRAIAFLIVSLLCSALVMLRSRLTADVFAGMAITDPAHPYYSSTALDSLLKTARFYLNAFANPWVLVLLGLAVCLLILLVKEKKKVLGVLALCIAGLCAYAPYLLLPNRTIPHSFYISYVLAFAPVLALTPNAFNILRAEYKKVCSVLLCTVLLLFSVNSVTYYSGTPNVDGYAVARGWLASEVAMRITLQSKDDVNNAVRPGDHVLVKGLENHSVSAFSSIHPGTVFSKDADYDVATNEAAFVRAVTDNVGFVLAEGINEADYDVVISYSSTMDSYDIFRA